MEATISVSGPYGQPIHRVKCGNIGWSSKQVLYSRKQVRDEKEFLKHGVPQHRKDRNLSRKCTSLIRRQKFNDEVVDRSWLCFSPSQTCVKCSTCRLLCADATKCAPFVIRKGIFDLKHSLERLRSHEHSTKRIVSTITF